MNRRLILASGAVIASLVLVAGVLVACGGGSTSSPSPSATASASPSASSPVAFEPWPPGSASASDTLKVATEFVAQTKAETLPTSNLLAADSTLDVYLSGEHLEGSGVIDYFTQAPSSLNWSGGTLFATAGLFATEYIVTTVDQEATVLPCVVVATVDNGKVTHEEVYGNDVDGSKVEAPKPVASKPGAADTADAAQAAVSSYFTALAEKDVTAAAGVYSPQVVFQDTTVAGPAGGAQEAIAWHTSLAAVPDLFFEPNSIVAGNGWAVARWVFAGDTSYGLYTGTVGATLFEVRDGKIVRQTLYYVRGASPFAS